MSRKKEIEERLAAIAIEAENEGADLEALNKEVNELTKERSAALSEAVEMSFWENIDDSHVVMRIVTSWATTSADVDALIEAL